MSVMLVASSGGHLGELHRLVPRLDVGPDPLWVTFDAPQSRTLLAGERTVFVPFNGPRQAGRTLRTAVRAAGLLRAERPSAIVTTGAAVAVSFVPVARLHGIPCHYIESAARSTGPSLTGKLVSVVPGTRLYSQYPGWAAGRWLYRGSVFDDFVSEVVESGSVPRRVLVTFGMAPYGFPRLVTRLLEVLPSDVAVTWQTGHTDVSDLSLPGSATFATEELTRLQREADVVVAHGGVGSALDAMAIGRCPLLVPRERAEGEHIDDHQALVVRELADRGLAVARRASELTLDDLSLAAGRRVRRAAHVPGFELA